MTNKLLISAIAFCLLFFQSMMLIDNTILPGSESMDFQDDIASMRGKKYGRRLAEERGSPQLQKNRLIEVRVISFTKLAPLPEHIPACEGCKAITIILKVTCLSLTGCENLSVMDFYVTYDSDYPTLFYGDESPNPALQGTNHAGVIYGAQKEFSNVTLAFEQVAEGELSFTVKPDASNFVLRYYRLGHGEEVLAVPLENFEEAK